ncbi:MAG TPA: GerMN domain-containing protein [Terracidiphilus sp.]|nr:GerMN domain-containing protein [Terracidiphilus sp.]
MIPRHQKVLFAAMLAAALAMGGILWHLSQRAHQRLLAGLDSAPTKAPAVAPTEQATLLVANDADGSLLTEVQALPLPADPQSRARVILGRLLDLYAQPGAAHPVTGGAQGIANVFLLPAPRIPTLGKKDPADPDAQLAVVNLTAEFAASHPSGLETETLTVLSLCGTLRANLPHVTEVRFLIDGQPRPNLAGHADLTQTYLTADAVPVTGDPAQ